MSNEKEVKYIVIGNTIEKMISLLKQLGTVGIISYTFFKCIEVLAGKETLANIDFKFLGNFNVAFSLSITLTGLTSLGWYRERKKRKSEKKRLTKENKELRRMFDEKIGSSMLEKDGTTNKKDL